ncbi:transcriptional regulator [Thiocystis minor]|uniref:helix-turn-helix domain-containing protein n=1 Tax=Thiocystis minor TaxID=61597 RepID=UPI001913DDD6|nr:helix-turn-helix transcriptional regulator [Thiocystis minor]MBK5965999.1 transcriptional regulator [Thiocystis minor]
MQPILSPTTRNALRLLGGLIEEGRLRKGWSREQLAERVGVGVLTIRRVIQGEPGVAIGTYFEAATLVGIPLFGLEPIGALERELIRQQEKLQLLPARIRRPNLDRLDDDF